MLYEMKMSHDCKKNGEFQPRSSIIDFFIGVLKKEGNRLVFLK